MAYSPLRSPGAPRVWATWQQQGTTTSNTLDLGPQVLRQHKLLPRVAASYIWLRALPRRVRRALQRHTKQSVAGLALLLALGGSPAAQAGTTITVSGGDVPALIEAINKANSEVGAFVGPDTIVLDGSTFTLAAVDNTTYGATGLPVISTALTIEGNHSTIERADGAPEFRLLAVGRSGELTLQETTVSGEIARVDSFLRSGDGGVFNYGSLTIQNSTLSGNVAGDGGGVFNSGALTIESSTLSGNRAGAGGGVVNRGSLTIGNSTISGNYANGGGGGVFNCRSYNLI